MLARAPHYGAGAILVVPALRSQPADLRAKHHVRQAGRLSQSDSAHLARGGEDECSRAAGDWPKLIFGVYPKRSLVCRLTRLPTGRCRYRRPPPYRDPQRRSHRSESAPPCVDSAVADHCFDLRLPGVRLAGPKGRDESIIQNATQCANISLIFRSGPLSGEAEYLLFSFSRVWNSRTLRFIRAISLPAVWVSAA
jgi:hypothetical protein